MFYRADEKVEKSSTGKSPEKRNRKKKMHLLQGKLTVEEWKKMVVAQVKADPYRVGSLLWD